jgi:hypothetical protein
MSDLWLEPAEVVELTAKKRWAAQCRELAAMGVPFMPNAVGRPLVERAAVCKATAKPKAKRGPNWDALRKDAA